MGVRLPSVVTNTFIGPLPANSNETVVLTTPPLNLPLDNAVVLLVWSFSWITGVGSTNHFFKLRRGTTATGTVVTVFGFQDLTTAANNAFRSGVYFDSPGAVAGQQYSLTVAQSGATGAGTFQDGAMLAFVL